MVPTSAPSPPGTPRSEPGQPARRADVSSPAALPGRNQADRAFFRGLCSPRAAPMLHIGPGTPVDAQGRQARRPPVTGQRIQEGIGRGVTRPPAQADQRGCRGEQRKKSRSSPSAAACKFQPPSSFGARTRWKCSQLSWRSGALDHARRVHDAPQGRQRGPDLRQQRAHLLGACDVCAPDPDGCPVALDLLDHPTRRLRGRGGPPAPASPSPGAPAARPPPSRCRRGRR
jgi:hypothetical protein